MFVIISCLVVWGGVAPLHSRVKRYRQTKIGVFIQLPKFLTKFFALLLNHEALTLYVLRFMFYVMRRSLHSLKSARFAVQKKGKRVAAENEKSPKACVGRASGFWGMCGFGFLLYI